LQSPLAILDQQEKTATGSFGIYGSTASEETSRVWKSILVTQERALKLTNLVPENRPKPPQKKARIVSFLFVSGMVFGDQELCRVWSLEN